MKKKIVLTKTQIKNKILRISFEIIENNIEEKELDLIGLNKNGYIIAKRIGKVIKDKSTLRVNIIKMTLETAKISNESILSEKIQKGKRIMILIDDVLKSGETIIYGIKHLLNYNVKKIKTAILIKRNHNDFPVGVNYVGLELSTTLEEHIQVVLNDKNEVAYLN